MMVEQKVRLKYSRQFNLQRRMVAYITAKSWQNVPHVSYLYEPDITDFYEKFKLLADEKKGPEHRLSLNTIMLKVIIEGLKSAPELNALIEYHQRKADGRLLVCEDINISVPWLLPDGRMITPVIFNSGSMSLDGLSEAVNELGQKIAHTDIDELINQAIAADTLKELRRCNLSVIPRILFNFRQIKSLAGKNKSKTRSISGSECLTDKDLTGGTVTVSNIGSLYKQQKGYFGLLEIIPPQIFVVGLGAVLEKPGVYMGVDGHNTIGIRKILPMCLVFDHRAVDFNALVPFIQQLDEIFAKPGVMDSW
jgi:pyruvate dehydrogenase E2 component (dihydrolipoamide acetyltransferase)